MNQTAEPQVALVSGAGRSVGRAAALALAREGYRLALQDLSPLTLDPLAAEVEAQGGRARAYVFDATRQMPAQALVDQVMVDWGGVDLLVNCAPVELVAPLLRLDEWDWHRTLDLNLTAPFLLMQAIGRAMHGRGPVRVINVAVRHGSLADERTSAATGASLAGLVGLSRQAAYELAGHTGQVFAIYTGLRSTPSTCSLEDLQARLQAAVSFLACLQVDSFQELAIDLEDDAQLTELGLL